MYIPSPPSFYGQFPGLPGLATMEYVYALLIHVLTDAYSKEQNLYYINTLI